MFKRIFIIIGIAGLLGLAVVKIPNPVGAYAIAEAKAAGYIEYSPRGAYDLAKFICTQCHTEERIKLYCARCGPPFITVIPHMQVFIHNYRQEKPELEFVGITEPQGVAIVQVWNALVGNWEGDFRSQDIHKLIGNYDLLWELYNTPIDERPIEAALLGREDLKMGYLQDQKVLQQNLGKPENNPGGEVVDPKNTVAPNRLNNPCSR
ncbi:MAG: hypothetical protein V3S46_00105 [Nitrospinota bacterium]